MTIICDQSKILDKAHTPMMQQYLQIKEKYLDALLFYRMGDFYELFFEDAIIASKILDIFLTKRGKHENLDIPMCGVPHHASEYYLNKLIKSGYKVAICEQIETPQQAKKRGYKEVVKREVVRVLTPGTITENDLLTVKEANYLAVIARMANKIAIAWLDLSTSLFYCSTSFIDALSNDLAKINPKELLISEELYHHPQIAEILKEYQGRITTQVASFFQMIRCKKKLKDFYHVEQLDSFANYQDEEIIACGAMLEYLTITQKNNMPLLPPPKQIFNQQFMIIDFATRKNLELMQSLRGDSHHCLLNVLDQSQTSFGARLLRQYLSSPLIDSIMINNRLNQVEYFVSNPDIRNNTRAILAEIDDIERALSRINLARAQPRDLLLIKDGLQKANILHHILNNDEEILYDHLVGYDELINLLDRALTKDVSQIKEGGFIKAGYNQRIDQLVNLSNNKEINIAQLKEQYREKTGINTLKIEHNNIIGYYIEVTMQHAKKMGEEFIKKASTSNYLRYTTTELKNLEDEIIYAKSSISLLELELFQELVTRTSSYTMQIIETAHVLAQIDVMTSFAHLANEHNFIRPIVDDSCNFIIKNGRHPVVEASLAFDLVKENFIANDCDLSINQRIWLITGPNMAGKSTFLRQNAIIVILAQIGCFVPASFAHIGVVDRIFSRIGAGDDLAKGKSTFMVEMSETAVILNQATSKSLVILDEIGRGTATYDGLAIALSCLEYLHDKIACKTLFATHYHELSSLSDKLPALKCYTMKVEKCQDQIIFLHQVIPGSSINSYGIYVAKMAGLPYEVIIRANQLMLNLSSDAKSNGNNNLPLFNKTDEHREKSFKQIIEILHKADLARLKENEANELLLKLKLISLSF